VNANGDFFTLQTILATGVACREWTAPFAFLFFWNALGKRIEATFSLVTFIISRTLEKDYNDNKALVKGGLSLSGHLENLLNPSLTILVPLWFIIIFLVFFHLGKLLISGFLKFKGNFVLGQENEFKIL